METEYEQREREDDDAHGQRDAGVGHAPAYGLYQEIAEYREEEPADARPAHGDAERGTALGHEPVLDENRRGHNEHEGARDAEDDACRIPLPKLVHKPHRSLGGRQHQKARCQEHAKIPFRKVFRNQRIRSRRGNEVEREVQRKRTAIEPQLVADRHDENPARVHDGPQSPGLKKEAPDHHPPCIMDALRFLRHGKHLLEGSLSA